MGKPFGQADLFDLKFILGQKVGLSLFNSITKDLIFSQGGIGRVLDPGGELNPG